MRKTSFFTAFVLLCFLLPAGAQTYTINLFAGNGAYLSGGDGGPATAAGFEGTAGVATDAAGNVYIADQNKNRVRKVDAVTGIITNVAGNNNIGLLGNNGPAANASLNGPAGLCFDAAGNLYIADGSNHCIRKIDVNTGIISVIAGTTQGFSGDNGLAVNAQLQYPNGVAVDASGNIYIADANNYRIRKVTVATGIITTVAGSGSIGFSGDGGPATSAAFDVPWNVRVDIVGNLYIADRDNNRIRKVDAVTQFISTIAGSTYGYSGDGGPALNATFRNPSDLCFDAAGNMYITDSYNRCIRKINTSGTISTIAGTGNYGYSGDGGPALSAETESPEGITVDAAGRIYFSDPSQNRVRVLQPLNGLAFDGSNDYVGVNATVGNFGTGDFTVEAWFKTSYSGANTPLVSKRPICLHSNFWNLSMDNGKVFLELDDNNTNYFGVTTPLTYSDGQWHHVAGTRVGTTLAIYIDGVLAVNGSYIGTATNLNNSTTLKLGVSPCGYFQGTLDEVRLWDRALCLSEINNNRNGSLPQPLSQSGLVAYYTFDEGLPAGSNTGVTGLPDVSGKGNSGTLLNFALTGTTSNYVTGTTAITGNAAPYSPGLVTATVSTTHSLSGMLPTAIDSCGALLSITPSGSNPVNGNVDFKVTIDGSVQTSSGGTPYLQRHFDVEPAANAATATANITLYFTQAEFTAFNAARGAMLPLPADAADAANDKDNLRITQFHGVPAGGNAPGNYPGAAANQVIITPALVAYNSNKNRWEVTFPVTGFSGFFGSTNIGTPLPVKLLSFTAKAQGSSNVLNWNTATETEGTFEITRSADGRNFEKLGTVAGRSANGDYTFPDEAPLAGINYYRLQMVEPSGETAFSKVVLVNRNAALANGITVGPVPAGASVTISTSSATLLGSTAVVLNMQGQIMARAVIFPATQLDMQGWPAGIYTLKFRDGTVVKLVKQ